MRTLFLLDRADLAALRSGEPFDLQVGGNTITLQAEQPARRRPATAAPAKSDGRREPRRHSATFKAKVIRTAQATNAAQAGRKYDIAPSLVRTWMRAA